MKELPALAVLPPGCFCFFLLAFPPNLLHKLGWGLLVQGTRERRLQGGSSSFHLRQQPGSVN